MSEEDVMAKPSSHGPTDTGDGSGVGGGGGVGRPSSVATVASNGSDRGSGGSSGGGGGRGGGGGTVSSAVGARAEPNQLLVLIGDSGGERVPSGAYYVVW